MKGIVQCRTTRSKGARPLWVKANIPPADRDVRFTPKADMCGALPYVRFVPKADIVVVPYEVHERGKSALAILRLITSSNLVGCSTGSSARWAPF